ncbi:MAG: diaminopimelate epimerase, partial [Aquificaceae bacterium]
RIVSPGRVEIMLGSAKDFGKRELSLDGKTIQGRFINTGVEHFVVFVEDIESVEVNKIGRQIRFHESFMPAGTNVNFVSIKDGEIFIRTYERGVEAETLSCGTGACACAIATYLEKLTDSKSLNIFTFGGDRLSVRFDESLERVFLEGPVCKVYDATLDEGYFSG